LDIIGESQAMQNVFRAIGKLSNTIATVLIQGESGTGKELIAKSLHKNSPRHDMPFIALNMADIPKELVESELFGHEKGSFTGAVDKRIGRFEQANGGTLFLDEIGDMPLESQTRLLRVLSNKEFYRVGGDKPIKVDVRIIAATHQNLNNLVSQKNFREDLFYRLNVIKVDVPPLRDRKEDISDLSKFFLKNYSDSLIEDLRVITDEAMTILKKYDWPGNVRQLENVCYWLTLMSPSQNVKVQDLPTEVKEFEVTDIPSTSWEDGMQNWLKNVSMNIDSGLSEIAITKIEKMLIRTALEKSKGKKNDAAQILGWGRNTLSKKMKEHGI
jgi:two-component system nitrogen regulation response regulator GlnG